MNTKALKLEAQAKLHKANFPIRPVVSESHKRIHIGHSQIASHFRRHIDIRYTYSLRNTLQCAQIPNNINIKTMKIG